MRGALRVGSGEWGDSRDPESQTLHPSQKSPAQESPEPTTL